MDLPTLHPRLRAIQERQLAALDLLERAEDELSAARVRLNQIIHELQEAKKDKPPIIRGDPEC